MIPGGLVRGYRKYGPCEGSFLFNCGVNTGNCQCRVSDENLNRY